MGKHMTASDVRSHQEATHGEIKCTCKFENGVHAETCPRSLFVTDTLPLPVIQKIGDKLLNLSDGMTVPEREFDRILAGKLKREEIVDYRYQGVSLAWGRNPKTGKFMRYKCDFWVWNRATLNLKVLPITIAEVKGPRIWPKDLIRFRGCRAEWPMLNFELHQRSKEGTWERLE